MRPPQRLGTLLSVLLSRWGQNTLFVGGKVLTLTLCACAQSCPTLCDPMDSSSPGSSVHGIFQARNTGVGFNFLFQGIFQTQGSNPHLLHRQTDSLPLHHQEVQILTLQPYFIFLQFFPTCGLVIKIFRTFLKAEFPKLCPFYTCFFSSVQFSHSVVPDSLWPHEPQHARPPCPSPTPRVHPNL